MPIKKFQSNFKKSNLKTIILVIFLVYLFLKLIFLKNKKNNEHNKKNKTISKNVSCSDDFLISKEKLLSNNKENLLPTDKNLIIDMPLYNSSNKEISIKIDKKNFLLELYANDKKIASVKVGIGKNSDLKNKKFEGDSRTPEGNFTIVSTEKIYENVNVDTDSVSNSGSIISFFRLDSQKWVDFGIKGTTEKDFIGTFISDGTILVLESELKSLSHYFSIGTRVLIK